MKRKKYTLADLKNFKKDEEGNTICPKGDYTAIRVFDGNFFFKYSVFGDGTTFKKRCSFIGCRFGKKMYI